MCSGETGDHFASESVRAEHYAISHNRDKQVANRNLPINGYTSAGKEGNFEIPQNRAYDDISDPALR
jgi:hypothetical protein